MFECSNRPTGVTDNINYGVEPVCTMQGTENWKQLQPPFPNK